ncbi:MAG: class I SAM-dependent methyltransferase [Hominilimicola sp.]
MENKASITALMSAFAKAYHSENSNKPLFNDFMARALMTDEEYNMMRRYIIGGIDFFAPDKKDSFANEEEILKWIVETQLAPTPLARTKFCEDSLRTAVMTGTEQYVILGAGLDTFAWRGKELMQRLEVFEADHPMTQADKKKRIERAGLEMPQNLHFVSVDFSSDNLYDALIKNGFDKNKKTFFSWLGVSYYLAEKEINSFLKNISEFAADGSTLLFDFADEKLFTSKTKRVQNMIAMAAAGGEPMKSCFSQAHAEELLGEYKFLIYEFLTPDDIYEKYFKDRTDYLTAFENINYALAVLKG